MDNSNINYEQLLALKKRLRDNSELQFPVISDSMHPLIKIGQTIKVAPINPLDHLRQFDLIVFWDGAKLICHYFWDRGNLFSENNEELFYTRSLKNIYRGDIPFKGDQILGQVVNFKINFINRLKIVIKNIIKRTV